MSSISDLFDVLIQGFIEWVSIKIGENKKPKSREDPSRFNINYESLLAQEKQRTQNKIESNKSSQEYRIQKESESNESNQMGKILGAIFLIGWGVFYDFNMWSNIFCYGIRISSSWLGFQ